MDMYDKYITRLGISQRATADAVIRNSTNNMERMFHTSPSFYQVDIDGETVDTIINKTTDYNIKLIHFRSDYEAQVGSIITFKDKKYLLLETDNDEIYSFGKMEECNATFSVQTGEKELILDGRDEFGRPKYNEVFETIEEPCVIRDTYYSTNENAPLPLPDGKLEILIKYQKAPNIKINNEFQQYEKTYKISDISYVDVRDGVGIMRIHAERRDDSLE